MWLLAEFRVNIENLFAPKASLNVVVDHSCRLHVGIAYRRADKLKSALFQILAQRVGLYSSSRVVFQRLDLMDDRLSTDKAPNIGVEAAEFFLNREKPLSIVYSGQDFCSVADDARIIQQRLYLTLAKSRDLFRVESGKDGAIILSFSQHGIPAQPRLSSF